MFYDQELARVVNRHFKRAEEVPQGVPQGVPQEPAPMEAAPPQMGQPLAPPPPPPPTLAEALGQLLQAKYAVLLAYVTYGDQLQCIERDGLYAHFQVHITEERDWIYALHRTLTSLDAPSYPAGVVVPPAPLKAARPAIEALLGMESELLELWGACAAAVAQQPELPPGEAQALTAFFQEGARVELAHVQDLRRYLGGL